MQLALFWLARLNITVVPSQGQLEASLSTTAMTLNYSTYRNQDTLVCWLSLSTALIKAHDEHKKQTRIWSTWPLPGLFFFIPMRCQV